MKFLLDVTILLTSKAKKVTKVVAVHGKERKGFVNSLFCFSLIFFGRLWERTLQC
jgi:hypothetical protein